MCIMFQLLVLHPYMFHSIPFRDLSSFVRLSLFCLVCQLHILVALQWNQIRLHAAFFSVSFSLFFGQWCLSVATFCSSFFSNNFEVCRTFYVSRSANFFAPQFAKHNDRSWIWCVMRFPSHMLCAPTTMQQQHRQKHKKMIVFSNFLCVSTVQPIYPIECWAIFDWWTAACCCFFDIMNGISYSMFFKAFLLLPKSHHF